MNMGEDDDDDAEVASERRAGLPVPRLNVLEKSIMERFDDNSKQVGALKDKLEYLNSLQAIGEKQRQRIYEAIVKVGTANDVSFKEYVKSFFLTSGGNTRHLE